MEKIKFEIEIDASAEKVWDVLWNEATYPEWTSAFGHGGKAISDWNQGSKVLFMGDDSGGMLGIIDTKIPNEFISIRYVGIIANGVEDQTSEEAKKWSGMLEDYTLKHSNGKTNLTMEMDILEEYKADFLKMWPKAMEKIKEIAERN